MVQRIKNQPLPVAAAQERKRRASAAMTAAQPAPSPISVSSTDSDTVRLVPRAEPQGPPTVLVPRVPGQISVPSSSSAAGPTPPAPHSIPVETGASGSADSMDADMLDVEVVQMTKVETYVQNNNLVNDPRVVEAAFQAVTQTAAHGAQQQAQLAAEAQNREAQLLSLIHI